MAGVDPKFNALRVFPPEINYPDIMRDENFFELIGCSHLAPKYSNKVEEKVAEVVEIKTTARLKPEIIDKIDWRVWETEVSAVGQQPMDPARRTILANIGSSFKSSFSVAKPVEPASP